MENGNKNTTDIDYLQEKSVITPDDIVKLTGITRGHLHSHELYTNIIFSKCVLRDFETGKVLFDVEKNAVLSKDETVDEVLFVDHNTKGYDVQYRLNRPFMKFKTVSLTIDFKVGDKPIEKLRMIERYYFRGHLLKTYDFEFGFCLPNSCHSWDIIYQFPCLPTEVIQEMIENPYETQSDTFIFANDVLIVHNKSVYAYNHH